MALCLPLATVLLCVQLAPGFLQAVGLQELLALGCPVVFAIKAELCISCTAPLAGMCRDVESSNMGGAATSENVVKDLRILNLYIFGAVLISLSWHG